VSGLSVSDLDHTRDPDVALMLAFQRGDEEAFVTLFGRFRERIANFARRLLGDQAQGEEAAQEVFLKLYSARERYRPDSRFSTYLYRIARNHCLNLRARRDWTARDPERDAEAEPARHPPPEHGIDDARLRLAILQALARLPENQASAFVLCQYEGMSLAEAAAVLELSTSAIKSLVFRARQGLMELLRPYARELSPEPEEARHAVP
jgi:RNA polymerase sigma-70 factor (ECF subfamily)